MVQEFEKSPINHFLEEYTATLGFKTVTLLFKSYTEMVKISFKMHGSFATLNQESRVPYLLQHWLWMIKQQGINLQIFGPKYNFVLFNQVFLRMDLPLKEYLKWDCGWHGQFQFENTLSSSGNSGEEVTSNGNFWEILQWNMASAEVASIIPMTILHPIQSLRVHLARHKQITEHKNKEMIDFLQEKKLSGTYKDFSFSELKNMAFRQFGLSFLQTFIFGTLFLGIYDTVRPHRDLNIPSKYQIQNEVGNTFSIPLAAITAHFSYNLGYLTSYPIYKLRGRIDTNYVGTETERLPISTIYKQIHRIIKNEGLSSFYKGAMIERKLIVPQGMVVVWFDWLQLNYGRFKNLK